MDYSPFFISLKISSLALIITSVLGIFLAYIIFNMKSAYRYILDSFINILIVLPPVVSGFLILILFGRFSFIGGVLDKLFNLNIIFTQKAAVIASVFVTLPLMYRAVYSSFMHINKDLIETANVFGAKQLQIFFNVFLPLSIPGIMSGLIISFTRSLGEFGATLMAAGNIPKKTQTISSAIYFFAGVGDFKSAFFWVFILLAISFVFMFLLKVMSKERL